MKSLTLIVSPSGKCNLSCDYCYNRYNLSNEILDYTVLQYLMDMVFKENDFVHFVWRGGEPLIVGIDYYKRAFQYQRMAAYRFGARYSNSIQTNGVLIDRHWINYAKRTKFSFGISFDGTTNDCHRGSTEKVLEAFDLCRKKNFPVGCLTVVNQDNINLVDQYKYIKQIVKSVKFSPCFSCCEGQVHYEISAKEYSKQLIDLFLLWVKDESAIEVDPLVNYIYASMGIYCNRVCNDGMCLGSFLDIDASGMARICSHSRDKQYKLGHITSFSTLSEIFNSDGFNIILKKMIKKRDECREKCKLFGVCMGGCCVNRLSESKYSCEVLEYVYPFINSYVKDIFKNNISLSDYNPLLRKIILSAISQNPTALLQGVF